MYMDYPTPLPAGNHPNLYQSLSKHGTYAFNPDYYPLTPYYFIAATNAAIFSDYAAGFMSDYDYLFYTAAANDTFYGCLVERFGDQGLAFAGTRVNVGEVSQPINGSHFIQDTSGLNISGKLTGNIF